MWQYFGHRELLDNSTKEKITPDRKCVFAANGVAKTPISGNIQSNPKCGNLRPISSSTQFAYSRSMRVMICSHSGSDHFAACFEPLQCCLQSLSLSLGCGEQNKHPCSQATVQVFHLHQE